MLCDPKIDQHHIRVLFLAPIEDILGLHVAMYDIVVVQVLDGGHDGANDACCVYFGETASLQNAIEELAARGFFEDEVVLRVDTLSLVVQMCAETYESAHFIFTLKPI